MNNVNISNLSINAEKINELEKEQKEIRIKLAKESINVIGFIAGIVIVSSTVAANVSSVEVKDVCGVLNLFVMCEGGSIIKNSFDDTYKRRTEIKKALKRLKGKISSEEENTQLNKELVK